MPTLVTGRQADQRSRAAPTRLSEPVCWNDWANRWWASLPKVVNVVLKKCDEGRAGSFVHDLQ
ncbi:hypothetical protein ACWIG5_23245 [Streptomyces lydicus]